MKIIVSRTDSIGDVILTLPLCGWIKRNIIGAEIYFVCQKLTYDIINHSKFVDHIHIWDGTLPDADVIIHVFPNKKIALEAKRKGIKKRIGTSHRFFHIGTCNKLIHFSRIKSDLHESQLNFKLLKGLSFEDIPKLSEMSSFIGWDMKPDAPSKFIANDRFNLIFHIKSRGSAKEWKASNYLELARKLPITKFRIIITGTEPEGQLIRVEIPKILDLENVIDTTGKLSLTELIQLISQTQGLLACSTGPLHIAATNGVNCLGMYPNQKPMHAGRWGPIGVNSDFIEELEPSKNKNLNIQIEDVYSKIMEWVN